MAMPVEEITGQLVKDERLIADCNKFVQAVASKVASEYGMNLRDFSSAFAGTADNIRARFDKPPFISIANDKARATKLANEGQLVLGGLSLNEMRTYEPKATMGHIVVIAPGGPSKPLAPGGSFKGARGGYPYCYQGAHIPQYRFKTRTQVDVVFPKDSLPHINYAYINILKKQLPLESHGLTQD
jgi:hypothetical protein